jgi:hypothetical protein
MNDELQAIEGMTLRDYFAAHAPRKPQAWFKPVMDTPRPEEIIDHECRNAQIYRDEPWRWDLVNEKEVRLWDVEYQTRLYLQWPYAYADAMLKAREQ